MKVNLKTEKPVTDLDLYHNSCLLWVLNNWLISDKGKKTVFDEHKYLVPLYLEYDKLIKRGYESEKIQRIVIQKSAQAGGTEVEVSMAFFLQLVLFEPSFIAFPSTPGVISLANTRMKTCLDNPKISAHVLSANTGEIICQRGDIGNIARVAITMRGSMKRRQIISVPAAGVFIDEVDEHAPTNVRLIEMRTGGHKLKLSTCLSTPTFPEYGINALYLASSQGVWMVKCPACGKHNELKFKNIKPDPRSKTWAIYCYKPGCGSRMNRFANGEYVHRYPDRPHRGFHISKLFSPRADLGDIIQSWKEDPAECSKSDLGLPYSVDSAGLSKSDILQAIDHTWNMRTGDDRVECTGGVDVGKKLHCRLSLRNPRTRPMAWAGELDNFDELDDLIKRFNVRCGVIDAQPEIHSAMTLIERHPGWFRAFYDSNRRQKKLAVINLTEQTVTISRSLAMAKLIADTKEGRNKLCSEIRAMKDYRDHLEANIRVEYLDTNQKTVVTYVRRGRPDHYAHAEIYDLVAQGLTPPMARITTSRL